MYYLIGLFIFIKILFTEWVINSTNVLIIQLPPCIMVSTLFINDM